MGLTLQAIKYMICFQVFLAILSIVVYAFGFRSEITLTILLNVSTMAVLYLFYIGLEREYTWVAIVFFIVCIMDLMGAIPYGINMANSLNLVDAIFSTVAIFGIIKWWREDGLSSQRNGLSGL